MELENAQGTKAATLLSDDGSAGAGQPGGCRGDVPAALRPEPGPDVRLRRVDARDPRGQRRNGPRLRVDPREAPPHERPGDPPAGEHARAARGPRSESTP